MQKKNSKLVIIYMLIVVLGRLIPHPPNVTPLTSLSLFAGAKLSRLQAVIIMLLSLIISDIGLSYLYGYPVFGYWSLFSYSGFLAMVLIGNRLAKDYALKRLISYVIVSSFGFWLWTNFGAWLFMPIYTKNIPGLFSCYVAALPFLRNAVLGDLGWMVVIFGIYSLVLQQVDLKNRPRAA
ncbi:MAG: hypothetical protein KAT71_03680 [Gammaproteobacteria bacterium]|nr:hypothetical protein [Gammaproteobacteria bacterium]